jgi:hypothetical protein
LAEPVDITKMSFVEIMQLVNSDPEIINRLVIAKKELIKRQETAAKIACEKAEADYQVFISPIMGSVIKEIRQIRERGYHDDDGDAGETHIFTDKCKIVIDGTISEVKPNE